MAGPVVALTFSVADGTLRLVSHRRLVKSLPSSDPVAEYRGRAGTWFEVDDAAGQPLYGRHIVRPLPSHHEVSGPEGGAKWLPRSSPVSEFEILVPLLPDAATVAVFSSRIGGKGPGHGPAREIVRINLRDLPP